MWLPKDSLLVNDCKIRTRLRDWHSKTAAAAYEKVEGSVEQQKNVNESLQMQLFWTAALQIHQLLIAEKWHLKL